MNRYDAHLNKKIEINREDQVNFRTKVYNRDIDGVIKRIHPVPNDVLFVETTSLNHDQMDVLNGMIVEVVDKDVKVLCTNASLKIDLIKPQSGHVLAISSEMADEEFQVFKKTLLEELGEVDYKVLITNHTIEMETRK